MSTNGAEAAPQHSFEIPPPPQEKGEVNAGRALESGAPDENRVGKHQPPQAAVPATPPLVLPGTDDNQTQTDDSAKAADDHTAHPAASHGDVIERQWVDKAKAIIAKNQDDPYLQKSEMSKAKADYIKKRFNKTVPTDDTVPV